MSHLIKNAKIVDGTGNRSFEGDVLIAEGKIKDVGNLKETGDFEVIDGADLVVCPGFIDINTHSDTYWTLFDYPGQESLVTQGITTIIGGNCGSSLAPLINEEAIKSIQKYIDITRAQVQWSSFKEFLKFMEGYDQAKNKQGQEDPISNSSFDEKQFFNGVPLGLNFGSLVGHATLRRAFTGDEDRELKKEELEMMVGALDSALTEGAFGFSTGLIYSHLKSATLTELMALARTVAKHNGIFSVHLRQEGKGLMDSVKEVISLAKETGVSLQISHLKACGRKSWPLFGQVLDLIDRANEDGFRVSFDVYPYTQAGPVLYTLIPQWATAGGKVALLKRLKDPEIKRKILLEMQQNDFDYGDIIIAKSKLGHSLKRRRIADLAEHQERTAEEVVLDLLLAADDQITTVVELMNSKNVEKAISHEQSMVSSNGIGYSLEYQSKGNLVHPRCFGAMTRFIKNYVLEHEALTLEQGIEKITSRPARKLGLDNVGTIEKGKQADITVFDPRSIRDFATMEQPFAYSQGIEYVFVNGELVLAQGKLSQKRPGKIFKKISEN